MSSVKATQLRPGMVIQHEGQLFTIFSVDHRTPGNKRGSMQTRMKNLKSGTMIDPIESRRLYCHFALHAVFRDGAPRVIPRAAIFVVQRPPAGISDTANC